MRIPSRASGGPGWRTRMKAGHQRSPMPRPAGYSALRRGAASRRVATGPSLPSCSTTGSGATRSRASRSARSTSTGACRTSGSSARAPRPGPCRSTRPRSRHWAITSSSPAHGRDRQRTLVPADAGPLGRPAAHGRRHLQARPEVRLGRPPSPWSASSTRSGPRPPPTPSSTRPTSPASRTGSATPTSAPPASTTEGHTPARGQPHVPGQLLRNRAGPPDTMGSALERHADGQGFLSVRERRPASSPPDRCSSASTGPAPWAAQHHVHPGYRPAPRRRGRDRGTRVRPLATGRRSAVPGRRRGLDRRDADRRPMAIPLDARICVRAGFGSRRLLAQPDVGSPAGLGRSRGRR